MLSPLRPSALVAAVLLLTLVFLLGQAESSTAAMQPEMHAATSVRQPLELEGELEVKRTAGEPPFVVGENYSCIFGRAGQFSLHMPPQDYRDLGVHTKGLGIASNQDTLVCTVPKVVTAGNTTVCVIPPNMSATHFPAFRPVGDSSYKQRPADITVGKHATCGVAPYAPRFLEHFPLFAPAFSRRPYFRETEGALILELDLLALARKRITISVEFNSPETGTVKNTLLTSTTTVAGLDSPLARERCDPHGHCRAVLPLRIPFSLENVPVSLDVDATIKLLVYNNTGAAASGCHIRRLIRAEPPRDGSGIATFQVDHETQALLRDGVPFIMSGWFAGGYGFESAGLPPAMFVGQSVDAKKDPNYLDVFGQASLVTQWGRNGITFVRSGSWTDPELAKIYLDAAAAAGVSVLWNVGVDTAARSMARIINTKTNMTQCGTEPTPENWEACAKEQIGYVKGNVTLIRDHPAVGGYYACDDCCHMPVLNEYGDTEYRMEAAVKGIIRKIDPWRLMFGSIACGETWYWTEEGAGLGMDVMMKEGYAGAVGNGFPYPAQYRVFPMTFEPLVLMPDPASLSTPHVYRAHSYSGAATAGMFHTNAFVENNWQFGDWQVGMAVAQYAAEITELLPAFTSRERFFPLDPPRQQVTVSSAVGTPIGEDAGDVYTLVAKVLTEQIPARGVTTDYYCHTLVTVNPHSTPCVGKFTLKGLLAGSGLPHNFPVHRLQAQRLFNGQYLRNFTDLANDSVVLTDILDERTANVYHIGCDTDTFASYNRSENLILDGDIETLSDPGAPGHLLMVKQPKGAGKPTATSYSAEMSTGLNRSDDRTRVSASLADPYNGRYSAKINLAAATPVRISLPVLLPPWSHRTSAPEYDFQLWVRSSPPGVSVELASTMFAFLPSTAHTASGNAASSVSNGISTTTSWSSVNATLRLKVNGTVSPKQNCKVPPYPPCDLPLEVKLISPFEIGGTVFLDGISLYARP